MPRTMEISNDEIVTQIIKTAVEIRIVASLLSSTKPVIMRVI